MAKLGRKKFEIDIQEVERLAGLGFTHAEICIRLGISERTFYNKQKESADFAQAIKRGKATTNDLVSSKLIELVKKGNLGAMIWYEKTRRGLTDKVEFTTWQDKVISGLRKGEITPEQVREELGDDLATGLFESIGLRVGQGREAATVNAQEND